MVIWRSNIPYRRPDETEKILVLLASFLFKFKCNRRYHILEKANAFWSVEKKNKQKKNEKR